MTVFACDDKQIMSEPIGTPASEYTNCALERLEEESKRSGIDVRFKQLRPRLIHTATWTVSSPMCIVQYMAADLGAEAIGSYPKEYTALHIALDKTILSQNGLTASQNKWILLVPGQKNTPSTNLMIGGHVLILFFHKKMIASFRDYEKNAIESEFYVDWYAKNTMWTFVPMQHKVQAFLASLEGYPFQEGSSLSASGINYNSLKMQKLMKSMDKGDAK